MAPQLKDLFTFLSAAKGFDLANITSPPSFLAPRSVVEVTGCWAERPFLFAAPAQQTDPQLRAIAVLKWILCSFKRQLYISSNEKTETKKPLNAFLGELFLGKWSDGVATSNVISEQVSHHPPVTAWYMWDDENGIQASGYARPEMMFTGSLSIKQTGHWLVHIDKYDEDYLIDLPPAKIQGLLTGNLYPELYGTCHIVSTHTIIKVQFIEAGYFVGARNRFEASVYMRDDETMTPICIAEGQWSGKFTIYDTATGEILDTWDPEEHPISPVVLPEIEKQDPWETRKAWKEVIDALQQEDFDMASQEKSKLETAQRAMRAAEPDHGHAWQPLFFVSKDKLEPKFDDFAEAIDLQVRGYKSKGVWRYDKQKAEQISRPFRPGITPTGPVDS